jgi:hypothetical protein
MLPDLEIRSAAMQAFLAKRQQAKHAVEHGLQAERTRRQLVTERARKLCQRVERDTQLARRRPSPRDLVYKTYDPHRQGSRG